MAKFAIKYEVEVWVEADIAREAFEKAGKVIDGFDFSGLHSVRYFKQVSFNEVKEKK